MYCYIFILCLNTIASMINTNVFFDFTDFSRRHGSSREMPESDANNVAAGDRQRSGGDCESTGEERPLREGTGNSRTQRRHGSEKVRR